MMSLPLSRPSYRADIDGLRALAVIGVIIYHAFPSLLPGGFIGVDVFFVISGFLISTLLFEGMDRGGFSIIDFYERRIRRIFPALIMVMTVSLAFGWFSLLDDEFKRLGKHVFAGAAFLSNFALWKESGYFDVESLTKPMMHLWSLGVEEQFYVVWPLFLLAAQRFKTNFLSITAILVTISLMLNLALVWQYQSAAFYMPFTRFWELMAGGMLAYLTTYRRDLFHSYPKQLLSIAGILLIAVPMAIPINELHFPGFWAILPVAGATCLIASGREGIVNHYVLSSRAAVWIGLISYPLYLWHWPLLSFLRIVESGTAPPLYRGCAILLAFFLAYGTYMLIEKPIRQGKLRNAVPILLALMIAIGLMGLHIRNSDGFPKRAMPVPHEQLASFVWDQSRNKNSTCTEAFALKDPLLAYCLSTDIAQVPTVAVIGDSHSNHTYWALDKYYHGSNDVIVNLGGPGGCLPIYGGGKITGICESLMDEVLDLVLRNNSIRAVYLSSRAAYISNTDLFEELLSQTLQRFSAAGKEVVIVLDVPEMAFDPKICMDTRRFKISTPDPLGICKIERQKIDEDQKKYRDAVLAAAKPYKNIRLLDLPDLMCDADYCWGKKNGKILYRDSNHLSVWGVKYLSKKIQLIPPQQLP